MSEPIEVLDLDILLVQADNLAAKDHNILGQPTTSDPYCVVRVLPQGERSRSALGGDDTTIFLGKTTPVLKTLAPKWGLAFQTEIPWRELTEDAFVEITIMDYDTFGEDDLIGVVPVHIPVRQLGTTTKWYGVPAMSAGGESATGRIQCTLTTKRGVKMPPEPTKEELETTAPQGVISDSSANSHSNSNSQDDGGEDDELISRRRVSNNRAAAIRERADRRRGGGGRRVGLDGDASNRTGGGRRGAGLDGDASNSTAEERRRSRRDGETAAREAGTTTTTRSRSHVRQTRSVNDESGTTRPRSRVRQTRSINDESGSTTRDRTSRREPGVVVKNKSSGDGPAPPASKRPLRQAARIEPERQTATETKTQPRQAPAAAPRTVFGGLALAMKIMEQPKTENAENVDPVGSASPLTKQAPRDNKPGTKFEQDYLYEKEST